MCGIAAHLAFKPEAGSRERALEAMRKATELMRRRGPDASGILAKDAWSVGHVRLSIMDPASGAQPWVDENSGCVLVYNGEIFNYRQLNAALEAKGRAFKTHCDTETVMAAYLEWGESCVEKFNGFFAFTLIDPREGTLFAARDRLGVKPLHYRADEASLSLASSVPAVLACAGGLRVEPDYEALSHYLTTGRVSLGAKTLAKGVMALPPAHRMKADMKTGATSVSRYWSRPVLSPEEKLNLSFEEAAGRTAELLEDAVRIRLMSDVPLGSFLSGGLDSSIIALCAAKSGAVGLPLFCAGSDDERFNEYSYAETMARKLGLKLERVEIKEGDFRRDWGFLIKQKGLPLSTSNEVSIFHLAQALSKSCKVTLTGEGADEIFGGYMRAQFASYDLERSMAGETDVFESSPLGLAMTLAYGRCRFLNDTDHFLSTACWVPYPAKARLFKPEIWDAIEEDSAVFSFYEDFFERHSRCSAFDRRMHLFAEFNLESLLHRIDNSTMAASVEARVPFTDYRLSELSFSLPDSYKMDWRNEAAKARGKDLTAGEIDRQGLLANKRLPREAFRKELPEEIVERPKMSFPVPIDSWLSGPMLSELRERCLESPVAKEAFDRGELESLLARPGSNFWVVANACLWSEIACL